MTVRNLSDRMDGDRYCPPEQRSGEAATVYFTRDLSAEGLCRILTRVSAVLGGQVAIKLHSGEPDGPNILPRPWVKALCDGPLAGAVIAETNTLYDGPRHTTAAHRRTLTKNGWTFAPVDILDADGAVTLPVSGGRWLKEASVGAHLLDYDSLLVLTHFKGHTKGGFGGCNKNIGIGCADGTVGKAAIHTDPASDDLWLIGNEEFMERMTESTKAVVDRFGEKIAYINVMRCMSVSCDCEGVYAAPVTTPDVGILASLDILAADQAAVDLIYAMKEDDRRDLCERMESRHGLRQLSYMKELGMGHDRYLLIDTDNGDRAITPAEAVKDVTPFIR